MRIWKKNKKIDKNKSQSILSTLLGQFSQSGSRNKSSNLRVNSNNFNDSVNSSFNNDVSYQQTSKPRKQQQQQHGYSFDNSYSSLNQHVRHNAEGKRSDSHSMSPDEFKQQQQQQQQQRKRKTRVNSAMRQRKLSQSGSQPMKKSSNKLGLVSNSSRRVRVNSQMSSGTASFHSLSLSLSHSLTHTFTHTN